MCTNCAYGWVLDLKEDKAEPISDEYIIAPSITHAKTAAVLRSAYAKSQRGDSHKDVDNNTLAINLSARRVRIAKRIIDGVKSGLAIGAILGSDLDARISEKYPVMAYPVLPDPTYFYLKEQSVRFMIPSVDLLKNTLHH